MIDVLRSTGLVTVQDLGWETGRAVGLPQGGAIDPPALMAANVLAGNEVGAAGLEIGAGSITLRFAAPGVIAATGSVWLSIDENERMPWTGQRIPAEATVTVRTGATGRFGYLAVGGGLDVPPTLGSRATYLPIGIGGLDGRRLRSGDRLPTGPSDQQVKAGRRLDPEEVTPTGPIRVIRGPQAHLFSETTLRALEIGEYVVSPTSDRMGTRLKGPSLAPVVKAALPSEAACPGALQIPDDGQPIAILADGPTVGGYPKIGVIISADLPRFGQCGPETPIRFEWVSIAEAQRLRMEWLGRLTGALTGLRQPRSE
ncbi:MAG: biotin-dependent carboxyltransferase family protein [Gemmatimonadales bacterium]